MAQGQQDLPGDLVRTQPTQMAVPGPAALEAEELALAPRPSSPGRDAWNRFRKNWAAMISLAVILILILLSVFAPLMHTTDPMYTSNNPVLDAAPSSQYWFGTDALGRDEYSRLLYGLRVPLVVGIIGAAITTVLGMLLGVIAGYFGGMVDSLLARLTDVMFAFPGFTLALIVVSLYGQALDSYFPAGTGRVIMLTVVFAVVGWPPLMRFVRSLALTLREQQFTEAARVCGTSSWKIMTRHLLPNIYGVILVQAAFVVVGFVGTEAVLSILGLGITPPNPDLGQMLADGTAHMALNYWGVIFPSFFLTIIILTFTFFGDGVRDAVDPRGKA